MKTEVSERFPPGGDRGEGLEWARRRLESRFPETGFQSQKLRGSGCPVWDEILGGGLCAGGLHECVVVTENSGASTVLDHFIRLAAGMGERVAYIDLNGHWDATPLADGVLAHVLWVTPETLQPALAAADVVLRDGNFQWLLFDLRSIGFRATRSVSSTLWYRMQRLCGRHGVCAVFFTREKLIPSAQRTFYLTGPVFHLEDLDLPRERLWSKVRMETDRGWGQTTIPVGAGQAG